MIAVPTSPAASRPGLDAEVILALQDLDRLVRDMRDGLAYPNGVWDETTAVQRYLTYVSMLVDIVLADLVMSALHANDMMVLIKQRMLVEYAAKGAYYNEHSDYALFMMTIDEAEQVFRKLQESNADRSTIEAAQKHRDEMRERYAAVSHLERLPFAKIMSSYGDRDDYVWLYGAPGLSPES